MVSIIVPVYNSENELKKCISSLCNQSYSDIEIILIDDGSTDQSLQICSSFAGFDQRIKVLKQDNSGVSKARNLGLATAQGKYIVFVDSDDYVKPDFINHLLQKVESNENIGLVIAGITFLKKGVKKIKKPKVEQEYKLEDLPLHELVKAQLWASPVNKIYLMSIIKKYKIEFESDLSYGEDMLFNQRYIRHCEIVSTILHTDYIYVQEGDTSLSRSIPHNIWLNQKRLLFDYLKLCNEIGIYKKYRDNINYYIWWSMRNTIRYEARKERNRKINDLKKTIIKIYRDKELQKYIKYLNGEDFINNLIIFLLKYGQFYLAAWIFKFEKLLYESFYHVHTIMTKKQ